MIVSDLTKSFNGKTIIDNITLSLNQNEVIGLVGPNGSGKSTLLKIISGQIPADKGKVKLNNETAFYLNQE
ncbi:MAG: ATP-binding cassette domain-containing protein, partial [Erysipelotrichaceae bacterium]|nr:ATP-binding cassette domain-containing protein [Erysipelotrichaceae bacterium]